MHGQTFHMPDLIFGAVGRRPSHMSSGQNMPSGQNVKYDAYQRVVSLVCDPISNLGGVESETNLSTPVGAIVTVATMTSFRIDPSGSRGRREPYAVLAVEAGRLRADQHCNDHAQVIAARGACHERADFASDRATRQMLSHATPSRSKPSRPPADCHHNSIVKNNADHVDRAGFRADLTGGKVEVVC